MTIARLAPMALVSAVAVGGCRKPPPNVPIAYQGNETLIIENLAESEVCQFSMVTKDDMFSTRNWLGGSIDAGKSLELKVKPGAYKVRVGGCESRFSGLQDVVIKGPTTLGIGKEPTRVIGAAVKIHLWMDTGPHHRGGGGGTGGGGGGGGGDERSCTGLCGGEHGNCCPDEGWYCVIDPKDARQFGDQATGICRLQ